MFAGNGLYSCMKKTNVIAVFNVLGIIVKKKVARKNNREIFCVPNY